MKLLLSGATGAMGQVVVETVRETEGIEIAWGWAEAPQEGDFPITDRLDEVGEVDVILDFSSHATAPALAAFALERGLPLVVATTGHDEAEWEAIRAASEQVPVFASGNMSLGVYVMRRLAREAAALLADFDLEVTEAHHHFKTDAPSGTAKMIIAACKEARPDLVEVHGRAGKVGARRANEIGVHALRGGTIVGEHTLLLAGSDECLTIQHTALSKRIFAKGALKACAFLLRQGPGLYDMDDMMQTLY